MKWNFRAPPCLQPILEARVEDARIWKYKKNNYMLSATVINWFETEPVYDVMGHLAKTAQHKPLTACLKKRSCDPKLMAIFKIDMPPLKQLKTQTYLEIVKAYFPCVQKETYVERFHFNEKNWSYWRQKGLLYMTYSLAPHVVFPVDFRHTTSYNKCVASLACKTPIVTHNPLEKLHSLAHFRAGSPAVRFSPKEFIAVGHTVPKRRRLTKRSRKLHVDYFIFFYTFSSQSPYPLLRVSDSFAPASKYNVFFPMGIASADAQHFVISYGEGDSENGLATLHRDKLNEWLYPVDELDSTRTYNFHNSMK